MKDDTTITVKRDTHKDLMLFKIQSDAKSIDEVLRRAIDLLKKVSGPVKHQGEAFLSNDKNLEDLK